MSVFAALAVSLLMDVPLVTQSTDYSCGAAALQSVLGYYGVSEFNESELMKEIGTDPKFGTLIDNIEAFSNRIGVKSQMRENLTLEELRAQIAKKQPVLVEIQAWREPSAPPLPYEEVWDDGHYVVVIGIEDEKVHFVDPSLIGSRGVLPVKDFMSRWHDVDDKGGRHYRTGVLFDHTPKPPQPWTAIP